MELAEAPGLRSRKRRETRARLEHAAVDLVLKDGLDNATVVDISDLAGVSPRTFFNYFESKEDAILGLQDTALSDEAIASIAGRCESGSVVDAVVRLLIAAMGSTIADAAIRESRMEILRRYPHLLGRHMVQMTRMHEKLTAVTEGLLTRGTASTASMTAPFGTTPPSPGTHDEFGAVSDVILSVCGSALRVAVKELVAARRDVPPEVLELRAIALVREAIEKIK